MARAALSGTNTLPPEVCRDLLTRIRWGIDTQHVEFDHTTQSPGLVYRLPRFLDGTNIAITWDAPMVGYVPSGQLGPIITWSYTDRLASGSGACNPLTHFASEEAPFTVETQVYATTRSLSRVMEGIRTSAEEARWEFYERFEPRARHLAMISSRKVGTEITDGVDRGGVVDDIELESIVDRYLLGDEDGPPARWWSLLERASGNLRPGVGDRLSYLETNVESTLDEQIRRKIGDPEKGRTIRNIHRRLGKESSVPRIQEEYRLHYPRRSGAKEDRILAALTVAGTANAVSFSHESPDTLRIASTDPLEGVA